MATTTTTNMSSTKQANDASKEEEDTRRNVEEEEDDSSDEEEERFVRVVPPPPFPLDQLPSCVTLLESDTGALVYLVGTAHVSNVSAEEVIDVIEKVRPDTVLLELCMSRAGILQMPDDVEQLFKNQPSWIEVLRKGGADALPFLLFSTFLRKAAEKLKVVPGGEFRAAYRKAKQIGCKILLGDRPVGITLKRVWAALTLWEKLKLAFSCMRDSVTDQLTAEEVEKFKDMDLINNMMLETGQDFPSLLRPLAHERDLFLTYQLRTCPGRVVVGVIGMGHVQGVKDNWREAIDIEPLMVVPPASRFGLRFWILAALTTLVVPLSYLLFR